MRKLLIVALFYLLLCSNAFAYNIAVGSYTSNNTAGTHVCFKTCASGTTKIENTCLYGTNNCGTDFTIDFLAIRCNQSTNGHTIMTTSALSAGYTVPLSTSSAEATGMITSIGNGEFVLPSSVYTNPGTVTCYYWAMGKDAHNDLAVGTYTANNSTDNTDITITPAFSPEVLLIKQKTAGSSFGGALWTATPGGDATGDLMNNVADITGCVKQANVNGFKLGTNTKCNANDTTTTYYYVAIKAVTGAVTSGSYNRTGVDDLQITTLGFTPLAMIIKCYDNSAYWAYRWGILNATDLSFKDATLYAGLTNLIQEFLSNGFEVGTDVTTNYTSGTYHYKWFAVGIPTYPANHHFKPRFFY